MNEPGRPDENPTCKWCGETIMLPVRYDEWWAHMSGLAQCSKWNGGPLYAEPAETP